MSEVTQYEALVIGAVLSDGELVARLLELLSPADFTGEHHSEIWAAVQKVQHSDDPVDLVTVSEHCEAPISQLAEYARECYTTRPDVVMTWAGILRDRARRDRFLAGLGSLAMSDGTADELLAQARDLLIGVEQDTHKTERTNKDIIHERLNAFSDRYDGLVDAVGLTLGVKDLDKLMYGLKPSELVIMAARPAMGKSALALQSAQINAVDHGKRVAFFSLEMGVDELFDRMIIQRAKFPADVFAEPQGTESHDINRVGVAATQLTDADINCYDNIFDIEGIVAKCRTLHQQQPLDLIVVDYLQLIATKGRENANRAVQVGEYSRALKMLAMSLGCPVLVLSQLNREVEKRPDKRPLMADLRESGSVEQDANKIVMLYRDEEYDENSPHKGIAELIVRKNRGGKTGMVPSAANLRCYTFGDLAHDFQRQEAPRNDPFA